MCYLEVYLRHPTGTGLGRSGSNASVINDGLLLCYVMCVLPDRLPAWGPFPFLSSVRLFSSIRRVVVVSPVYVVGASARLQLTTTRGRARGAHSQRRFRLPAPVVSFGVLPLQYLLCNGIITSPPRKSCRPCGCAKCSRRGRTGCGRGAARIRWSRRGEWP